MANYLKAHSSTSPARLDISAAAPYFGFDIPDSRATTVRLVRRADRLPGLDPRVVRPHGEKLDDCGASRTPKSHHFIARITYFHTLFWPAMLRRPVQPPTQVHILVSSTSTAKRMSESKGNVRQGRRTGSTSIRLPALLLRIEAQRRRSRSRHEPRRVRGQGEPTWWHVVNLASRTAKFAGGPAGRGVSGRRRLSPGSQDGAAFADAYAALRISPGNADHLAAGIGPIVHRGQAHLDWRATRSNAPRLCTIGLTFPELGHLSGALLRDGQQVASCWATRYGGEQPAAAGGLGRRPVPTLNAAGDRKRVDPWWQPAPSRRSRRRPLRAQDSDAPLLAEPITGQSHRRVAKVDLRVCRILRPRRCRGEEASEVDDFVGRQ